MAERTDDRKALSKIGRHVANVLVTATLGGGSVEYASMFTNVSVHTEWESQTVTAVQDTSVYPIPTRRKVTLDFSTVVEGNSSLLGWIANSADPTATCRFCPFDGAPSHRGKFFFQSHTHDGGEGPQTQKVTATSQGTVTYGV